MLPGMELPAWAVATHLVSTPNTEANANRELCSHLGRQEGEGTGQAIAVPGDRVA